MTAPGNALARGFTSFNGGTNMIKKWIIFSFTLLIFFSCASPPRPEPAPPPREKAATEFLLLGFRSPGEQKDLTEELLAKKKEVYSSLKRLSSKHNVVIVYDASASMTAKLPGMGLKRYEAAYDGLKKIGALFSGDDKVWLIVFGSRKPFGIITDGGLYRRDYLRAAAAGNDVEIVFRSREAGFDEKEFLTAITYLKSDKAYIGDTPIGYSILKAQEILKGLPNAKVILISDGEETGPLLAQNISKSKGWEQKIRATYPHLDKITVSAEEAIDRLVKEGVSFTPIIYGVTAQKAGGSADEQTAQSIRAFYRKMASASGSIYLEAATPLELLNAFMDAEMMSIAYTLSSREGDKESGPAAKGKIGIPLTIPEGRYLLRTNTEQPFEAGVEAKPGGKNIHVFDVDEEGKLKILRAD
jgi:hypothetical protein